MFSNNDDISWVSFSGITEIGVSAFHSTKTGDLQLEGVTKVGADAFYNGDAQNISFDESIAEIADSAFDTENNHWEYTVTFASQAPCSIGTDAFSQDATIFVPAGSGDAYKSAWSDYASQIRESSN